MPEAEKTENFEFRKYRLEALKPLYNQGMVFKDFKVPVENRLDPTKGGTTKGHGLTIAFAGLNHGRLAVLANSSGMQRSILANALPWTSYRESFKKTIDKHSDVQEMIGRIAANVVATEAMRDWVAQLMDQGFNCEMEAMNAKIFGSDCQYQSAEYLIDIHGGRAAFKDNPYLQMLIESKIAKIYEGHNRVLHLGHGKNFLDDFNKKYMEVIFGRTLLGQKAQAGTNLAGWILKRTVKMCLQKLISMPTSMYRFAATVNPVKSPKADLKHLSHFATAKAQNYWLRTFSTFGRFKATLVREQTVIRQSEAQKMCLIRIKAIAEWGLSHPDKVYQQACVVKCQELKDQYTGKNTEEARPFSRSIYAADLGRKVTKGQFKGIEGAPLTPIMKPYDKTTGNEIALDKSFRVLSNKALQVASAEAATAKAASRKSVGLKALKHYYAALKLLLKR